MSGRTIPPGVGEVGRERLATLNGARSAANGAANGRLEERLLQAVDDRTWQLLEHRRRTTRPKDRGWLVRRLLLVADLLGLSLAFLLSVGVSKNFGHDAWIDFGILIASLPVWIVAAKLFGSVRRGRVAGGPFDAGRPGPRLPSGHGRRLPPCSSGGLLEQTRFCSSGSAGSLFVTIGACRCPRGRRGERSRTCRTR